MEIWAKHGAWCYWKLQMATVNDSLVERTMSEGTALQKKIVLRSDTSHICDSQLSVLPWHESCAIADGIKE